MAETVDDEVEDTTLADRAPRYSYQLVDTIAELLLSEARTKFYNEYQKARSQGSGDRGSFTERISKLHPSPTAKRRARSILAARQTDKSDSTRLSLNDFDFFKSLGDGSYGEVWFSRERSTEANVAIKVMHKRAICGKTEHAHNEKNILLAVNNPFIMKLFGTFHDTYNIYFVMEHLPGRELWDLVYRKSWPSSDREQRVRFYAAQIVLALEYLHGLNILYRDLKPENVIVLNDGYLKICDFGFAKLVEREPGASYGRSYSYCGTTDYMAPEIVMTRISGHKSTTATTTMNMPGRVGSAIGRVFSLYPMSGHYKPVDWWSLGIFIFDLMARRTPFETDTFLSDDKKLITIEKIMTMPLQEVDFKGNKFSTNCRDVVMRLLEKNPSDRLGGGRHGAKEVREHRFFSEIDWQLLYWKQIPVPASWKPKAQNLDSWTQKAKAKTKIDVLHDNGLPCRCHRSLENCKNREQYENF